MADKYGEWKLAQDSIDFNAIGNPVQYEINRRYLAKGFGVRVSFLDKVVTARRKEIARLGIEDEIADKFSGG